MKWPQYAASVREVPVPYSVSGFPPHPTAGEFPLRRRTISQSIGGVNIDYRQRVAIQFVEIDRDFYQHLQAWNKSLPRFPLKITPQTGKDIAHIIPRALARSALPVASFCTNSDSNVRNNLRAHRLVQPAPNIHPAGRWCSVWPMNSVRVRKEAYFPSVSAFSFMASW